LIPFLPSISSVVYILSLNVVKRVYIHTILINHFQTSNQFSMKQYAVIHAVAGLFEGYSDTTCEFFPKRGFADKHIAQILDDYRKDEMCVNINHATEDAVYVTMTRDYDNYKACVPSDMTHDDYVAEYGDDVSVEVFQVIELDMSNRSDSTESCWLTWDQQDASPAWDYYPLCMSLVARVSSDVMENAGEYSEPLYQLNEFIQSVYLRNHAFIDVDDYTIHAFRIPKPKGSDSYDPPKEDALGEWMDEHVTFIE
jgi:hypothetical protein